MRLRGRRILLVSSSSGSRGGGELYLVGLAEGLCELGYDVECMLATHPRMDDLAELLAPWARVHRVGFHNTYDRRLRCFGSWLHSCWRRDLEKQFRRIAPDLIHMNKQNVEDGLDLLWAAQRSGIPVVTTIHITRGMSLLGSIGGSLRDWLSRRTLRQSAGHFITIGHTCRDQLVRFLREPSWTDRVSTVVNGVAPAPPSNRTRLRDEWGCRADDVVLGCVARLEEQKNPRFLLRVLPLLPKNTRLVWVGDGRLREKCVQAAYELGISDRIHWDGWRAEARSRMAGFDIFVLPSLYEGLPLAVLEAMAAGLPCVASDVDSMREAIADDVSGWLCPPGDLDSWRMRLCQLIDDESARTRLGQNARERWQAHFSLRAMAMGTARVYERVLGQRATVRSSCA